MNQILLIILLIILSLVMMASSTISSLALTPPPLPVCPTRPPPTRPTTTTPPSTTPSIMEEEDAKEAFKLDTYCDYKEWDWYVSQVRWEGWFYYYENVTDIIPDLPNLGGANGSWVARHWNGPSPIFEPRPTIRTPGTAQVKFLEITYYLHNNATIRIHNDREVVILKRPSGESVQWVTTILQNFTRAEIELIVDNEEDFVLIDKVVLNQEAAATRPPSVRPIPITEEGKTPTDMVTSSSSTTTTPKAGGGEEEGGGAHSGGGESVAKLSFLHFLFFSVVALMLKL